uniref:RNA-directed DNA polymerase, eukaryota, reverse transcriptase zinc-binding domain protein n=1 Tax=Tanacetum cinerariifolium TaxID=118510 RepID=A0A6L2JTE9_TANCI|nr:RNA-directed DNA polymerase, eukaryota, reverse transcriptase zinc-binding domain protein [Tanacetum cinerariifolium]
MSKLDRFLILKGLFELFPNLSGSILHRHLSDHKLIFLRESYIDYGPTLFCLFHSWFLENDFVLVVEDSWNNVVVLDLNAMVFLKNKLKILKHKLKSWSCQKRSNREFDRKELHDKLIDVDSCLNKGEGLHDDVYNRADVFHKIGEIDLKNSTDMAQKSKIKWAIEGMKIPNSFMCKAKNEQALMFKVDFQKAFNSVRWDYLDDILDKVPYGVLNQLEGICNSFFLGADIGIWLDVIKAIHGSNGALNQPLPNRLGCSVWNMFQKAIDVSVGHKLQNSNWAFSFRRRHRGGIEECQWTEFSQLLSSVVLSSSSDRESDPYLDGELQTRVCSHGGSDIPLSYHIIGLIKVVIVRFLAGQPVREDSKTNITKVKQLYCIDFDDFRETTIGGVVRSLARQGYGKTCMRGLNHPRAVCAIDARFLVGHFIQHCPTNGDLNFDIKRVTPLTGISKTMITTTTDGVLAKTNFSVIKQNVGKPARRQLTCEQGIAGVCRFNLDTVVLGYEICGK